MLSAPYRDLKEDTEILRTHVTKLHSDTQVITRAVTSIQPDIAKTSQSTTRTETNVESLLDETKEVHAHVEVIRRDVSQLNIGFAADLASLREQLSRMGKHSNRSNENSRITINYQGIRLSRWFSSRCCHL